MIRPPTTRLSPVTALAAICVAFIVACSSQPTKSPQANGQVTIADLPSRPIAATKIEQGSNGREKAILGYRRFLEQYPQSPKYDTIARRLADLLVESAADRQVDESAGRAEVLPVDDVVQKRYADAIAIYDRLLEKHPADQQTPELLYQLSRAYEATGQTELGLKVIDRLLNGEPQQHERLYADAQFRRGELLFTQGAYVEAAGAYAAVVELGESVSNYEQALYKLGWSQFKAQRYDAALAAFFMLLDRKLPAVDSDAQPATLSRAQQEQLDDVFRAVSMSFSLQGGVKSVDAYFRRNGRPSYQDQVYLKLAEFYVARDQISEASRTWLALAEVAPSSPEAPRLYVRAIELYEKAGFQQRVVETETAFVERFGVDSDFWKHHSPQDYAEIKTQIQSRLIHLAHYYHARAQRDHEPDDYREATRWYRAFLKDFADAQRAAEMNFRLAELLYEQGEYRQAIEEYKRTTWLRGDHVWKAEAGKAMLHAYAEYLKRAGDTDRYTVRKEATANAVRFTAAYPDDPASVAILAQTGVDLLDRKAYQEAIRVSEQFLEQEASLPPALMQTAWSIRAQAEYGQGDYKAAEYAYNRALQLADRNDPRWTALNTGRAAAIYKQAEQMRERGDSAQAATLYLRAADAAPDSSVHPNAQYDAATALLAVEAWDDAAHTLEQFRADHPEHPLQVKATQKLAYAYERSGHGLSAAGEYLKLGNDRQSESAVRREALRRSAALYRQVGEKREAIEILELYLTHFPKPVDDSIDVMQQLADLESASGNIARRRHWLNNIVAWDGKGGDASTQVVAAQAALELAEERLQAFRRIRLVEPLKKTLADKLREMKQALKAYETAIGYGVEPVTTAARYNIASMYDELSQELRVSKRPSNLDAEALAHYELLLEEQAAPFEQRAIEIYTSNVRQRNAQETDPWVQKSRQRLEALQPDRLTGLKPKVEAEDTR